MVLTLCKQALKERNNNTIKGFVFTAPHCRPQGISTGNTLWDTNIWSQASDAPSHHHHQHIEVQDPPLEEEDDRAIGAAERGAASLAMDSIGETRPALMNYALIDLELLMLLFRETFGGCLLPGDVVAFEFHITITS